MSEINFKNENTDNYTVEFYHYSVGDAVLKFGYDEDADCIKPHSVSYTKKGLDVGVKINVETVSNGFITKTGGKTSIHSDLYELKCFFEENLMKNVDCVMTYEELLEDIGEDQFVDMDSTILRLNTAYEAAQ